MKKFLMGLVLSVALMQSLITAADNADSDALISNETKEKILKNGAFAGGITLGIWGVWGLRHHLDSIGEGYTLIRDQVYKFTKDNPTILKISKWVLPIASLSASYYLIKYSQSKDKKEKKHSSFNIN